MDSVLARPWWRDAVIYQIYPRSFQDSNDDGIGDLAGITARLPYLRWLGVDALWLSPFYRSPQRDFGYDITDHTDVDPIFGSMDDFDSLLAAAHRSGLRIILDFVPNHTSIDHPWFAESSASRRNPRRDWYLWHDPAPGGGPPNNWRSVTGGSAWSFHADTNQFYLHSFLPNQPDLNWRNPDVVAAMHAVMRFWLERGVDGFRIDMVDYLIKDERLRDEPVDGDGRYEPASARYQLNRPETLDLLRGFREVADAFGPDRVLIGEVEYRLLLPRLVSYYGPGDMLHLPINFWLMFLPWEATALRQFIDDYQTTLPEHAWPNWVLGSHDIARPATRLGPDQARAAMLLLLTARGTPFLYYGDELGLPNASTPADQMRDPWHSLDPAAGRDPTRTPMPWTAAPNAGFCAPETNPWLPVGENHQKLDVASQRLDPDSTLALTRRLLTLRQDHPALRSGTCRPDPVTHESILSYTREARDDWLRVIINLGNETAHIPLKRANQLLVTTRHPSHPPSVEHELTLGPHEGCIMAGQ
jgi:alpha-glucosidase